MNPAELQKKIALYYSKLPPKAQEVFSKMEWLETLQRISVKYGLNDRQKEALGTETTLVLLGIINLIQYEEVLTTELELSRNKVDDMVVEIDESILKTIRPELNDAFNKNVKEEKEEIPEISPGPNDNRFEKLPKEIENVVRESNYQGILYSMGKEFGLNVTQMGTLEAGVAKLIGGTVHPDDFEEYLESRIALSPERLKELVNNINEKILLKIREKMMATSEKKSEVSIQKEDHEVLNNAGIEIKENPLPVPDLPAVPSAQLMPARMTRFSVSGRQAGKSELTGKVPARIATQSVAGGHPILAQKLAGYVQNEVAETTHSLENISKKDTPQTPPPKPPTPPP